MVVCLIIILLLLVLRAVTSTTRSRIMKLAMVHDLAEALAGDIAPFQNVSKEDKRRLEEEGLDKICATIGSDPIGARPAEGLHGVLRGLTRVCDV